MGNIVVFFLCLLTAFLPFEMLGALGELPSVARLLGLLVLASSVPAILAGHRLRLLNTALIVQAAYVVWASLSMAWALDPDATVVMFDRVVLNFIFSILVWEFAVTYGQQLWILRSLLIGMLVPLFMMFASFLGVYRMDWGDESVRYTGGGHDQNYMAMMLSIGIVLAVYLGTASSRLDRWLRPFYWVFTVLAAVAAMLTGSRSGFACLVAAAIFAAILAGVSRRKIIYSALVLGFVVFIGILIRYVVPMALQQRSTEFDTETGTLALRLGYWQRGLGVSFMKNPLAGIGAGGYPSVTTALTGVKTGTAHNDLILILVELGVIGLLLYVAFLYFVFRAAWSMPRRERLLWLGMLSIWFLESMAISSLVDKLAWLLWALVLCQAATIARSRAGQRQLAAPAAGLPVIGPLRRPPPRTSGAG